MFNEIRLKSKIQKETPDVCTDYCAERTASATGARRGSTFVGGVHAGQVAKFARVG